jgi:hypothetical protein
MVHRRCSFRAVTCTTLRGIKRTWVAKPSRWCERACSGFRTRLSGLSGRALSLVVKERVAAAGVDPTGFLGRTVCAPASPPGRRHATPVTPCSAGTCGTVSCSSTMRQGCSCNWRVQRRRRNDIPWKNAPPCPQRYPPPNRSYATKVTLNQSEREGSQCRGRSSADG